jgi:Arabidopsis protein of unknown function
VLSRDNLDSIKDHIQDLQFSYRRGETESVKSEVQDYILSVKKASKDLNKLQAVSKNELTVDDSFVPASLLLEIRDIAAFLF